MTPRDSLQTASLRTLKIFIIVQLSRQTHTSIVWETEMFGKPAFLINLEFFNNVIPIFIISLRHIDVNTRKTAMAFF
jgi:hypothetical protein